MYHTSPVLEFEGMLCRPVIQQPELLDVKPNNPFCPRRVIHEVVCVMAQSVFRWLALARRQNPVLMRAKSQRQQVARFGEEAFLGVVSW